MILQEYQNKPKISSLVFFCPCPPAVAEDDDVPIPIPPNPFIKSSIPDDIPEAGCWDCAPEPPSPSKIPIRSSIGLLGFCGCIVPAGLSILCGVPDSPSSPLDPGGGWALMLAGAAPSKSMSNRFSMLFWAGVGPPDTAAVTAAAAMGFSRAS